MSTTVELYKILDAMEEAERQLAAADRLAYAVEEVAEQLAEEYYAAPIQASEALTRIYTAYREARVHTSDNAEDFLGELDSPEPAMKTHYDPIKEERARIRERVEQVGSLVRADPDEEWTTGYHDAIADVLTAIQEDTDE